MTDPKGRRRYLPFDSKSGYSGGPGVFYECIRCAEVLASLPPDSIMCSCRNIRIDVDYGRLAVSDETYLRVFVVEPWIDE
jgi:hypothetical protein